MIDIEKCMKEFVKYSKKYDLTVAPIMRKFHHTFRVMEYCKDIARSEKLSSDDVELAMLCGLLHDIARFEEWTQYQTYSDSKAFDHGDRGETILRKRNYINHYTKDKKIQELVLTTIRNHNKFNIEENLDDKTLLMCKIVRDADKIDIIKEQCTTLNDRFSKVKPEIMNAFSKHQLLNNVINSEESDDVFRELLFTFDYNFKYTFKLMKDEHIIDNKFNLLINYSDDVDTLNKLQKQLLDYVDNMINE